ncbi:MAG: SDR family NAD(P)-dependent oxidoreductase [Blastocatellia bacterium]
MKTRFAEKIAIVTGGGGEIGRATALRPAREGATVVVDCNKDQAEKVAAEITSAGGQAWAIPTDIAERDQVEAMASAVFDRHGRIDVLCNIAGIAPSAPLLETTDDASYVMGHALVIDGGQLTF